jgi:hypothetical protein
MRLQHIERRSSRVRSCRLTKAGRAFGRCFSRTREVFRNRSRASAVDAIRALIETILLEPDVATS